MRTVNNFEDPSRLASAVSYAARAHAAQFRKREPGDSREKIPYLSHLLAVAGIVIEDLGDEDEAIAGLLHDVVEDQDPEGTRAAEIESLYGGSVLAMVLACSSPKKEDPGMAEFRVRKQVALDHLTDERNVGALRVALADKVHNARCTVNDLEAEGPAVWDRFNSGVEDQLWWYDGLTAVFIEHGRRGRADAARANELSRLALRMRELSPPVPSLATASR